MTNGQRADIPDWVHTVMTTWGEVTAYREDGGGGFPRRLQTRNGRGNLGSKVPNVQLEYLQACSLLDHELTPPAIRHLLQDRYYMAARGYTRSTWESVQAYFGAQHMGEETARSVSAFWEGALHSWAKRTAPKVRGEAGAGAGSTPPVAPPDGMKGICQTCGATLVPEAGWLAGEHKEPLTQEPCAGTGQRLAPIRPRGHAPRGSGTITAEETAELAKGRARD